MELEVYGIVIPSRTEESRTADGGILRQDQKDYFRTISVAIRLRSWNKNAEFRNSKFLTIIPYRPMF